MPTRLNCDEAMNLSKARLRVQDPELKEGQVEKTKAGSIYLPWGTAGGFAVVYKFRTKSGKHRALRCYLTPMDPDIQFRYERIGAYFASHIPDITASFKFHSDGILINDLVNGVDTKKPFPLIEMEWIEGTTLVDHVESLCKRGDSLGLGKMLQQWVEIMKAMRAAKIAHCDLAGGNIMVRKSDKRLVLIDYDGVYIPDFNGRPGLVQGQPDYQHPLVHQRRFNEEADAFSAMVIYTALLALHLRPGLWNTYASAAQTMTQSGGAQDNSLLFRKSDFDNPDSSSLFRELERINDARLNAVVRDLKRACSLPIDQVRLPLYIIDPDIEKKEALARLEQAIQQGDDEEITKAWVAPLLDSYAPAQKHRTRLQQAQSVVQKLKTFRAALQSGTLQQIIDAYDPELDNAKNVTREEREILQLARQLQEAFNSDNDEDIAATWDEIGRRKYLSYFRLDWPQEQRRNLAQRRVTALAAFKQALTNKSVQDIVRAYDPILETSAQITAGEREVLQLARQFTRAWQDNDDAAIIAASEAIQRSNHSSRLLLNAQEQQRLALARQRLAALEAVRAVLTQRNIQRIVAAYDPVLDNAKGLTAHERAVLHAAKAFVETCQDDDDQAILSSSQHISASYAQALIFTPQEEQRIALAQQRVDALALLRYALASKSASQVAAAYNPILASCKNVTTEEREQVALAFDLAQAYKDDDDATIIDSWQSIEQSRHRSAFALTTAEEQRLAFARRRVTALQHFRDTLKAHGGDAARILAAYDPVLDNYPAVRQDEWDLLQMARQFRQVQQAVLDGIQNDSDDQILAAYDEAIVRQFAGFTPAQQERINRALKRVRLEQLLRNNDHRSAILLAQEIERESRKQLTDFRLMQAKSRFIRKFEARDVAAWRHNDEVLVQWSWPADDLVHYAVIVWRTDRWPQSPKRQEPGTGRELVMRGSGETRCMARFVAPRYMAVYLQVYFAIPDYTQQPPAWFYSDGFEPGSKTAAYYSGPDAKFQSRTGSR